RNKRERYGVYRDRAFNALKTWAGHHSLSLIETALSIEEKLATEKLATEKLATEKLTTDKLATDNHSQPASLDENLASEENKVLVK
ncbi:MAG: hypothetical protein AAFN65_14715, partial [Bacteroidota bacterium]